MSGSLPLSPHIDQTADIERVRFQAICRLRRLIRLHRPRTISAGIKANAWSLPEHPHVSDISRIKGAVAIPQAANKSAARLFSQECSRLAVPTGSPPSRLSRQDRATRPSDLTQWLKEFQSAAVQA